jgi:hypothetical protein
MQILRTAPLIKVSRFGFDEGQSARASFLLPCFFAFWPQTSFLFAQSLQSTPRSRIHLLDVCELKLDEGIIRKQFCIFKIQMSGTAG